MLRTLTTLNPLGTFAASFFFADEFANHFSMLLNLLLKCFSFDKRRWLS